MINAVDRGLERFLRLYVPLPETGIDISFEAPERAWGASLTRPTVNCFLWEVTRSPGVMRTGIEQRVSEEGAIERRRSQPIVDLRYLVTTWASELADEHRLLGSVLAAILAYDRLPADSLPEELAGARCRLALAAREQQVPNEFWSSMGGRMKPGLRVEVSLPLEVFDWTATAAPAEEVGVTVGVMPERRPAAPAVTPPAAVRRRAGGALVMEGRAEGSDRRP